MQFKTTLKIKGNKVAISILDSYQEYCGLGYPKDPKVYVIQGNRSTLDKAILELDRNAITKTSVNSAWGFQTIENSKLEDGILIFGPEQIYIKWEK
jgi:hypothetical protein